MSKDLNRLFTKIFIKNTHVYIHRERCSTYLFIRECNLHPHMLEELKYARGSINGITTWETCLTSSYIAKYIPSLRPCHLKWYFK